MKKNKLDTFDDLVQDLEHLRSRAVDLEAMAHAAEGSLEFIPNLFRVLHGFDPATMQVEDMSETRRNLGRLHTFVVNTSHASAEMLGDVEQLLDRAQRLPRLSGTGKNGSSSAQEPRAVYHVNRRPGLTVVA